MREWTPEQVARAAGVAVEGVRDDHGPSRAVVDSREAGPGDLFVGLRGEHVDGGAFAGEALARGAWGVIRGDEALAALQRLATAWRRELAADVIGVTGSTGKTSTKDVIAAMVGQRRPVVATRGNYNTEIGLPLTILEAPAGTEVLVLEMAMRGRGQIAELARIAEPDVGVVTNVGPVHLEQMGSLEAIAAEKAALIAGLRTGGTAVVPRDEPLLVPHLRDDVTVVEFGPGDDLGDVELEYDSAHMRLNAAAALAAARAVGVEPHGTIEVALS
ncbi:MAG TPA: Mur ligase family protein, partial [Solirubrobacteraceae bacterium]|nr:Mur ligase family protein [Solirubrobacteraceae bacterium]